MRVPAVPSPANGRVVVAGDWHGNAMWAMTAVDRIADAGIDTIVHVGDLGVLWPGDSGKTFEFKLERALAKHGVTLTFADGNHDCHTRLRKLPLDEAGFAIVTEHIRWAPRGHRWSWPTSDGRQVRFGALGGAFSIDWRYRKAGTSWWPIVEEVQPVDLTVLGTDPLDVLITHDTPTGAVPRSQFRLPVGDDAQSQVSRDLLRHAIDTVHPRLVFCGHWHQRRTFQLWNTDPAVGPTTLVEMLSMDGRADNWVVLDLDELSLVEQRDAPSPASTWL